MKRKIINGVINFTTDKEYLLLNTRKKGLSIRLVDKPFKGSYKIHNNCFMLPQRIVDAYGIDNSCVMEESKSEQDMFDIETRYAPSRVPKAFEFSVKGISLVLREIEKETSIRRPINDGSSVSLKGIDHALVTVGYGARKFAVIEKITAEEYKNCKSPTFEALQAEYGHRLQYCPFEEYSFKVASASPKLALGTPFGKIAKEVDMYTLKDKVVLIPYCVNELTSRQIDTTKNDIVELTFCRKCNDETDLLAVLTEKLAVISKHVHEITCENERLKNELITLREAKNERELKIEEFSLI